MPAALLAGSFGRRDPGEEAILAAVVEALPGWDPVVVSSDPEETTASHGCDAVEASNGLAVGRAVRQVDAAVLAGGVLEGFGEPDERAATTSLGRAYAVVTAARTLGKPSAMVGVGAGDMRSRRRRLIARALVRKADLFVLRDGTSAASLSDAGAPAPFRVGADPAWTLFERDTCGVAPALGESRRRRKVARADAHVVVALDRDACDAALTARLTDAIERLRADGIDVVLQPWRGRAEDAGDLHLAGAVAASISGPVEVLEPPRGLRDAGSTFAGAGLVLALRRHTLMAAATGGVPSLAITREPGLADLAARLGQPSVGVDADAASLARAVRAALRHRPPAQSAIRGQIASAEEGFKLLRLLLSRGQSDEANDLTGLRLEPKVPA